MGQEGQIVGVWAGGDGREQDGAGAVGRGGPDG